MSRHERAARSAELEGDLASAAQAWIDAKKPADAARVLVVRAQATLELEQRFALLVRARDLAPAQTAPLADAVNMLADLVIARTGDSALSSASKRELSMVAGDLERIGEHGRAAELFQRAGDADGRARNLALAGGVDELDDTLAQEAFVNRLEALQARNVRDAESAEAGGDRRQAARLLQQAVQAAPQDETVARTYHELRARRLAASSAVVLLRGASYTALFDGELVVGRGDASIVLSSPVVSKRHLRIFRRDDAVWFEDLGTRGGTHYRGARLTAPLRLEETVELELASAVRIALAPSTAFARAVEITVAGARYVGALGELGVPTDAGVSWSLARGPDGWLELRTPREHPCFRRGILQDSPVTLLRGDAFASQRDAPAFLELES